MADMMQQLSEDQAALEREMDQQMAGLDVSPYPPVTNPFREYSKRLIP